MRCAVVLLPCSLLVVLVLGVQACSSDGAAARDAGPDAHEDVRVDAKTDARPRAEGGSRDAGGLDAGAPRLSSLSVRAPDAAATLTLMPTFDRETFDYYVRCATGSNTVTVSMTAAADAESQLVAPTTSPPMRSQTLEVSVRSGAAIVARASAGVAETDYWVRCLPGDFPVLAWDPHPEAGTPAPGYYLVANDFQRVGEGGYAMVLNGDGVPVWYGTSGSNAVANLDSLDAGQLSVYYAPLWTILELSPLRSRSLPEQSQQQHELQKLRSGNYVITYEPLAYGDLTGYDVGAVHLGPDTAYLECAIAELDAVTGLPVWTWAASDHLDPVKDAEHPVLSVTTSPDGGIVADPFHCNSISVDPANDNLLVSGRTLDSVFYVEKRTGKILWKMGGPAYTKDSAVYVKMDDAFNAQHDARLQPTWTSTCTGGAGQISVFDDATWSEDGGPARAMVFDVSVRGLDAGSDCGPPVDGGPTGARVAWTRAGVHASSGEGSFRISADGSRVIGWGDGNRVGDIAFTEVDDQGRDLLDFSFDPTVGNTTYRAIKVPLSELDLDALRAAAGKM